MPKIMVWMDMVEYREGNLFYLNAYGCLERTCSHLINKLMFKYPYNVEILKDYDQILERYALSC